MGDMVKPTSSGGDSVAGAAVTGVRRIRRKRCADKLVNGALSAMSDSVTPAMLGNLLFEHAAGTALSIVTR